MDLQESLYELKFIKIIKNRQIIPVISYCKIEPPVLYCFLPRTYVLFLQDD